MLITLSSMWTSSGVMKRVKECFVMGESNAVAVDLKGYVRYACWYVS